MRASGAHQVQPAEGATVVIAHRLRENALAAYEDWLQEIAPLCKASPGHLDWHIVRPIPGLSETYTIFIRFDTIDHLRAWMESPTRARLIKKDPAPVCHRRRLLYQQRAGFLVHTCRGQGQGAHPLETVPGHLVGHIPAPLVVPLLVTPLLHFLGLPNNRFIGTFTAKQALSSFSWCMW